MRAFSVAKHNLDVINVILRYATVESFLEGFQPVSIHHVKYCSCFELKFDFMQTNVVGKLQAAANLDTF